VTLLAQKYAITPKTVATWKKRETEQDALTSPQNAHTTTLTLEEEAATCVAFRNHRLGWLTAMKQDLSWHVLLCTALRKWTIPGQMGGLSAWS